MSEVKFEKVTKYAGIDFALPTRKTRLSAGYDFTVPEDIIVPSHYAQIFKMLKEKLSQTEFLESITDLEIIKHLISIGQSNKELSEDEILLEAGKITKELPELFQFLSDSFTMDLDSIKELVKKTNTRMTLIPTGVKVKLEEDQKLELFIRSSTPLGAYLMMANSVGIIDADYYNNPDNEGHIYFQVINLSPFNIKIKKGEIIGQGIISKYDKTTFDNTSATRVGGFGSTSK